MADVSPQVPTKIGSYRVVRLLGQGGMSEVYLAHAEDEVRVAIKVCTGHPVKKCEWAGRLQTDVDHPHVMKYRGLPFDSRYQFLVVTDYLEVVPGTFEALRSRTFEEIVDAYARVADGLAHLDSKGITHGNVKTTNILCRKTKGELYPILNDAGLRYVYDPARVKDDLAARIFPYMAPEHLERFVAAPKTEQPASREGDVYSLAVSLVEALTGRAPFRMNVDRPDDPKEVLEAKRRKRYRVIFKNDPTTPLDARKFDELVTRALDPDPTRRPPLASLGDVLRGTIDRARLAALAK